MWEPTELSHLKRELTTHLEERDRLFPVRDEENSRFVRTMMAQYVHMIMDAPLAEWQPNELLAAGAAQLVDHPIFVGGFRKGGTTLIMNLMDNHPELVVMPGDSRAIDAHKNWVATAESERSDVWVDYWLRRFINPTGQRPFWLLPTDDDYRILAAAIRHWLHHLPETEGRPFLAAVLAYYSANPNRPPNPRYWIAKTPDNERRVAQIIARYPTARFIHVLREPYSNLASAWRLMRFRGERVPLWRVCASIVRSWRIGQQNLKALGPERYKFVSYEAMMSDPEGVLADVAQWLDVAPWITPLHATTNGIPAKANSMFAPGTPTGQVNINQRDWRADFFPWQRAVAITILGGLKPLYRF